MTHKVVANIYNRFGTDTGILFGISSKNVVETIIKLAIKECIEEVNESLGDYEGLSG